MSRSEFRRASPVTESAAEAVRAITEALGRNDYARAATVADAASARGVVHSMIPVARALLLEHQGRDEAALAAFREARNLSPREVRTANAIGFCLVRLGRLDEAAAAFEDAVRLDPSAAAHQRQGWALGLAGRIPDAIRAYERALGLVPDNVETLASLASLAARTGDETRARACAERSLALDPQHPGANIALALIEVGRRDFAPAVRRLRSVTKNAAVVGHERSVALALLGDALDGENAPTGAFEAYAAANAERLKLHAPRFRGQKTASAILDELIAAFAGSADERWQTARTAAELYDGPASHVFLLGFPRSGTTLLEQALGSHPGIVTLDERDFLADIAGSYLMSAAGIERLSRLDESLLAAHRETYWRRVESLGLDLRGRVFIDKHPFNTLKLPLIARLFPDAKVIFAIRDPRDVVLSCFRRQLEVDLLRIEFLTLGGAAGLYDRFMHLAELCRRKLSLPLFDHIYEDLVADFDAATQKVCGFVGVTWNASMRELATGHTVEPQMASAAQLRRGLYEGGVGRWRRYREQLDPVLPSLRPWVERFGYLDS